MNTFIYAKQQVNKIMCAVCSMCDTLISGDHVRQSNFLTVQLLLLSGPVVNAKSADARADTRHCVLCWVYGDCNSDVSWESLFLN